MSKQNQIRRDVETDAAPAKAGGEMNGPRECWITRATAEQHPALDGDLACAGSGPDHIGRIRYIHADAFDSLVDALAACRFELLTLVPRLTPTYRRGAQACVDQAKAALVKAGAE